jgi:hypothetical protein
MISMSRDFLGFGSSCTPRPSSFNSIFAPTELLERDRMDSWEHAGCKRKGALKIQRSPEMIALLDWVAVGLEYSLRDFAP